MQYKLVYGRNCKDIIDSDCDIVQFTEKVSDLEQKTEQIFLKC